jgi:hypothetical protein
MSEKTEKPAEGPTYRLPTTGLWARAWQVSLAVAVVGLLGTVAFYDHQRFGYSWLFAVWTFLAPGLGGLFFILAVSLTGAGWAVTPRRTAEFLLTGLPVVGLLFLPVLGHLDEVYPWTHYQPGAAEHHEAGGEHHEEGEEHHDDGHHDDGHAEDADEHHGSLLGGVAYAQEGEHGGDHAAEGHGDDGHGDDGHGAGGHHDDPGHAMHAAIVESKSAYLNPNFFMLRAFLYILLWAGLAWFFATSSSRMDSEKGYALTRRMESLAPPATMIFALSLTFAAFDWVMSLEPSWYSTIYGVQYFAVSVVSGLALMLLFLISFKRAGVLGEAVNMEHFHDIGKLLFGFIVFWAYISFSQFMLIWYAGIPEEAVYFHLRGRNGWENLTTLLIVAHFIIPFFILISRGAKRNLSILSFASVWMLVIHVFECFWLVMPHADAHESLTESVFRVQPLDVAALFAVGGIYMTVVLWRMSQIPLIPIGDPRLGRALHHDGT